MGQLRKDSSSIEIKQYFEAIRNLQNSGNPFPVCLEDVWVLVYSNKNNAARILKNDDLFIQNTDYRVLIKNDKNPKGGRPTGEYWLSVPCMEFFIARKVRAVFEVYRQVFHAKLDEYIMTSNKQKEEENLATAIIREVKHISEMQISSVNKLVLIKRLTEKEGSTVPLPPVKEKAKIALPEQTVDLNKTSSATRLLKRFGSKLSVTDFNNVMVSLGFLQKELGYGFKKFNVLIGDGLKYGKNVENPYYPAKTAPMYFECSFEELLKIVECAI